MVIIIPISKKRILDFSKGDWKDFSKIKIITLKLKPQKYALIVAALSFWMSLKLETRLNFSPVKMRNVIGMVESIKEI